MTRRPQYFSALLGDLTGAFQIVGGSVAGIAVQSLFKKRLDAAREVLLKEISAGEKDIWEACDVDEVVAIVYRYMRAAQEGTARMNLRLLARIIAGQKEQGELKADVFLSYADRLSSLSREEIKALAALYKTWVVRKVDNLNAIDWDSIKEKLIPSVVANVEELNALYNGLFGTGLLVPLDDLYNFSLCRPSDKFIQLVKLATFDGLFEEKTDIAA